MYRTLEQNFRKQNKGEINSRGLTPSAGIKQQKAEKQ